MWEIQWAVDLLGSVVATVADWATQEFFDAHVELAYDIMCMFGYYCDIANSSCGQMNCTGG